MLDFLKSRKDRHGITVYLIFGSIILVFIFWGFKTVDGPTAGYAAEVNHEIVTVGEFKRAFDRQLQFYGQFMGGQFTPKGEQLVRMKESVLESLIGSKLVSQAAEKSGFKATDAEIRDQIYSIPAFQQEGRFNRNIYKAYLEQSRLSTAEFENNLRESARMNLARSVISSVFKPNDSEAKKLFAVQNSKMNVDFVQLDSEKNPVSRGEVESFLKDAAHLEKITNHYNQNKGQYSRPEEVHAAHILIKATAGKEDQAQKKILEIAEKAKSQDFGKLAKEYSEDPGSKSKNGDLGFFSRGRMMEDFEKVAFALEAGKISAPVKTPFGFHIIKVYEKRAPYIQSFDEVKGEIAQSLIAEEKSNEFNTQADKLLKEGKVEELNKFITAQGLKWDNTGLFDTSAQTIPKLGTLPEFQEIAATLSKQKPLADRVLRYGNKAYIIRLKDVQTAKANPDQKDLQTVSQQVAGSKMGEIFESWQENLARSSTIHRNEMILGEF